MGNQQDRKGKENDEKGKRQSPFPKERQICKLKKFLPAPIMGVSSKTGKINNTAGIKKDKLHF